MNNLKIGILIAASLMVTSIEVGAQNFRWAKQLEGTNIKEASSICHHDGNVYVSGIFQGDIDLDPGTGTDIHTSNGDFDVFIQKLDSDGNLIWGKTVGGSQIESNYSIASDLYGNVYIGGQFDGTVDFDPNGGITNETSLTPSDTYLLKLDSAGNFVWVKTFEGGYLYSVVVDNDLSVYLTGDYDATFDGNPDAGVYILDADSSGGSSSSFVVKLNGIGDFVWANTPNYKYTNAAGGNSITLDNNGYLYMTGWFQDSVDFDPSSGTYYLGVPSGSRGAVIQKMDTAGNLVWAKSIVPNNTNHVYGIDISAGDNGNIYTLGIFNGTADFNPGLSVNNMTEPFDDPDYFIQALDANGNYLWSKSIEVDNASYAGSIEVDTADNIYVHGKFNDGNDLDPGSGIYNLYVGTMNVYALFVEKLSPIGDFIWAYGYGGIIPTFWGDAMSLDEYGNIYTTGLFDETLDFDIGVDTFLLTPSLFQDIVVHKVGQSDCSNFGITIDSLLNPSCASGIGYVSVAEINGQPPYQYSWNTSPISTTNSISITDLGIYTVEVTDNDGCQKQRSVIVNGVDADHINNVDLGVNLITSEFRQGFPTTMWLHAGNSGCMPESGQISLVLSENVDFITADPYPDIISGDTLKWNFTNQNYDSTAFVSKIDLYTHMATAMGEEACFDVKITPIQGDFDTTNNSRYYCRTLVTSFDPNDKQVYPMGACNDHYILNDQKLTYTVRFQNTGTSFALNVNVVDTLDPSLDISTLKIVGSSHPMIPELHSGNVMNFKFDNIYLLDSGTNEPESHGYFIYEIEQLPGLSNGTLIENSVGIYFDFNAPVITNTVFNTVIDVIPVYSTNQQFTICPGDSVNVGNSVYYSQGNYVDELNSMGGCDSIVNTNILVRPVNNTIQSFDLCTGESIMVGSNFYMNAGTYFDTLVSNAGCDSTIQTNLNVFDPVDVSTTLNVFTITANKSNGDYQWINCITGLPIPGANGQSFTPGSNGQYAVIVTNDDNCSDTSACVLINTIGINEQNSSSDIIKIYPNPTDGIFYLDAIIKLDLIIYNTLGEQVYTKKLDAGKNKIYVDFLADGIYFIDYIGNNHRQILVVQK